MGIITKPNKLQVLGGGLFGIGKKNWKDKKAVPPCFTWEGSLRVQVPPGAPQ